MNTLQRKISILLAGFLNGLNFFPTTNNAVSRFVSGGRCNTEYIVGGGLEQDAERLRGDWLRVEQDIRTSYDKAASEIDDQAE